MSHCPLAATQLTSRSAIYVQKKLITAQQIDCALSIVVFELWPWNAGYELWTINYGLLIVVYDLWALKCELWIVA